uniref:Sepiapterin reductase n=1 Tax=Pseudo-nitzschia australis TaxID=44445 RepID=A0A7S4AXQ8_9STRA|mmetsp:Transcript_27632/g.60833  ORF Transcript_27632/g.60833 Transcript_27632/m.60833 type:complete len:361 (-) Transcript_27632:15-1097(-)
MAAASSSSTCSSVVFLITGASKGLGRAIATVASKYHSEGERVPIRSATDIDNHNDNHPCSLLQSNARFVLVARSSKGLDETKQEILSTRLVPATAAAAARNEDAVVCRPMDLSDLDRLDGNMDVLLDDVDRLCSLNNTLCTESINKGGNGYREQQRVVFVNNAGSLGHLGPCTTSPSLEDMRRAIDLNVTSSLWLSVRFARHVKEQNRRQHPITQQKAATLVNLSSLVAVSDEFLNMGIYSAGKAARERYHTLLAKEEWNDHNQQQEATPSSSESASPLASSALKILNYAPGPLETEMTNEIRVANALNAELQARFQKPLLDPSDSALKLIRLVEERDYFDWESGAHIDYYDLPDNDDNR